MRIRPWMAPASLVVLAVALVAAPRLMETLSTAAFTDSRSATANVVTAAGCTPGAGSWPSLLANTASPIPSADRAAYNRLAATPAATPTGLVPDTWLTTGTWSSSGMLLAQPGALYCDPNTAIAADASTDFATSPSTRQSTYGLTASVSSTVMIWVRPASGTSGRLLSLANGTGGSSRSDRVLWIDASGHVNFAAYDLNNTANWTITGTKYVADARWHLLVVTMNGYNTGGATVTVDGVVDSTQAASSTHQLFSFGTSNVSWTLGALSAASTPTGAPTGGAVTSYDEFVLVDATTPLTTAQILSLYQSADV